MARRSPHNGTFSFHGDDGEANFSWINVGGWVGYQGSTPGFEMDIVTDDRFYSECTSMTTLPVGFSDCITAGKIEEDGIIAFGVGSWNANEITPNTTYEALWHLSGNSSIDIAEYSISWQETYKFLSPCVAPAEQWCWIGVPDIGGERNHGKIIEYVLSKSLPHFRWWALRDHSLSGTNDSRLEPDGPYWSGSPGRHSGFLTGPDGSNFDLSLLKWIDGEWVEVSASTAPSGDLDAIEYTGQPGYYVWEVTSKSGGGTYQVGVVAPDPLPPPLLSVSLGASPNSGTVPLSGVDLTAALGETSPFSTNYTFYCNRPDSGTNITPGHVAKFDGILSELKTAADACSYSAPGTYTAKVIAERGPVAAEARTTITVTDDHVTSPSIATLAATGISQQTATLNLSVNPNGSTTTAWFQWGSGTSSLTQSTPALGVGAGTSNLIRSSTISSLSCDTQYFFQALADGSGDPASGTILSFRTSSCGGGGGGEATNLIQDPSFEAGNTGWWVANPDFYISNDFPGRQRSGSYYAYLSDPFGNSGNGLEGGIITPILAIPSSAESAELSFWHSISTQETTNTKFDELEVYVVDSNNQLSLVAELSNLDHSGTTYLETRRFLSSSFLGENVQIFFRGATDSILPTVFRIDDVSLWVTASSAQEPTVTTLSADQIGSSSARLNMEVNPNGTPTEVWFDFEAGDSTPNDDTPHFNIGTGNETEHISYTAAGLDCETLYYFEANASNSEGSNHGAVRFFTTDSCPGAAPWADTDPAESITAASARLTAEVNPNQLPTEAWFEWGPSTSLGAMTARQTIPAGSGYVDVTESLSGLSCDTTYYFRVVAENSRGSDNGAIHDFTTSSCSGGGSAPAVETLAADNVSKTSARLDARVNPNGDPTEAWFAWGTTPVVAATTARQAVGTGTSFSPVSSPLSGLSCGTTYYFKVIAANSSGLASGEVLSFSTAVCDPSGAPPGTFFLWAERQSCNGHQPAVLLRWSPAENASSIYTIYQAYSSTIRTVDTSASGFAFLVTDGIQYGQGYDFRVVAQNGAGNTSSNIVRAHIVDQECTGAGDPADPPGPFTLWWEPFTCKDGSPTVEIHWSASAGAETYTLERLAPSDGVSRTVEGLTTTSYLDTVDLVTNVPHVYRVTAHNQSGPTSALSAQLYPPSGLCGETDLPGAFVLVAGAPFCLDNEPAIPIGWTSSSGADNFYAYRVYGRARSFGSGSVNNDVWAFSYDVTAGVAADQLHEIYMVSSDPLDERKVRFSNSVFIHVPVDICGAPSLAPEVYTQPASGVTSDSAVLRSQVRPNGLSTTTYFEWGETAAYGNETTGVDTGFTALYLERPSLQITGLSCGTEYHYRVVALNIAGVGTGTDTSFMTEACGTCGPTDLHLADLTVGLNGWYRACNSITVGPNVSVEFLGDLRLTAPRVVFGDGFSVKSGGSLAAGPPH